MDGRLEEVFVDVFTKRLASTEIMGHNKSKTQAIQVGGATGMMGEPHDVEEFECHYVMLDDDAEPIQCMSIGRYSDTRRDDPSRPAEWRLGYPKGQTVMTEHAEAGDHIWIMRLREQPKRLVLVLAPVGSQVAARMARLTGTAVTVQGELGEVTRKQDFIRGDVDSSGSNGLDLDDAELLTLLGVPVADERPALVDAALEHFAGQALPPAAVLAKFVRVELGLDPLGGIDDVFMAWNVANDEVFFALERRKVQKVLNERFAMQPSIDVDAFFEEATKHKNSRFSRAGATFEAHLEAAFTAFGLLYTPQSRQLADGSKPDFLLPGRAEYEDDDLVGLVTFLGAKTTAKERWLQMKGEASRVATAHLATKDRSIAATTLRRMVANNVHPVIAKPIIDEVYSAHRDLIMSIGEFIEMGLERQARVHTIVARRA